MTDHDTALVRAWTWIRCLARAELEDDLIAGLLATLDRERLLN
jgi:hypothetical protein